MTKENWRHIIRVGLLMGLIILMTSVIGMVETFNERALVVGYLTLGQLLLYVPALYGGYISVPCRGASCRSPEIAGRTGSRVIGRNSGYLAGLVGNFVARHSNLFCKHLAQLITILTSGRAVGPGIGLLVGEMAVLGPYWCGHSPDPRPRPPADRHRPRRHRHLRPLLRRAAQYCQPADGA